jgi:hypothetical protein
MEVTLGAAPATLRRHEEEMKKMVDSMDPGAARSMVSNVDASVCLCALMKDEDIDLF